MTQLDGALALIARGWRVLPLWWIDPDTGRCACGTKECQEHESDGKHPLIKMGSGMRNASNELQQVNAWWVKWPNANIGVATGALSGIVVIDCDWDDAHDGYLEFEQSAEERGLVLPPTLMARTGSGGRHYIFGYPADGQPVKSMNGWLLDVDVKADGGYVVAPPSVGRYGPYTWLNDESVATAPAGLASWLRTGRRTVSGASRDGGPAYNYKDACQNGPGRGYRDEFFNARAYQLRKAGVDRDVALNELKHAWTVMENPPNDYMPWSQVTDKLERIWRDVDVDERPQWNPSWGSQPSGEVVLVTQGRPVNMFSDAGNAWRLVNQFSDVMRYVPGIGFVGYEPGTGSWVQNEHLPLQYAMRVANSLTAEVEGITDDDARDAAIGHVRRSFQGPRLKATVGLVLSWPTLISHSSEFDRDQMLLNVGNGVIDLTTGKLRPHESSLHMMHRSAVSYDPKAYDKEWVRFLEAATDGDQELIAYLRRATGSMLTGETGDESFFMYYGPPASGKSTYIAALTTVLGSYAMNTQPDTLMKRKGANTVPPNEIARMRGKRLVTATELGEDETFNIAFVKQITGGDVLTGRHLYQQAFDFQPRFKLVIGTNHKPRANDDGLFRRLKLIPFMHVVPLEHRNPKLKHMLNDPESSLARAALAWAVQGCLEWQHEGLGTSPIVLSETRRYQDQEDLIGQFISEMCEADPIHVLECKEAFRAWHTWLASGNEYVGTLRAFKRRMEDRGYPVSFGSTIANRRQVFVGLRLKEPMWTGHN